MPAKIQLKPNRSEQTGDNNNVAIRVIRVQPQNCEGTVIEIVDEDRLACAVARLMVSQSRAALRILYGDAGSAGGVVDVESIIERRLVRPPEDHRDGLLFQHIMWLAAATEATKDDVLSPPQYRTADNGQDGVIVHLAEGSDLAAISICEDKATTNPRKKVAGSVWPEIMDYETGQRDDELREHAIDALVKRGASPDDAENAVSRILWQNVRRYRVRVTVAETHRQPPRRGGLFDGFEEVAPGDNSRRRGETVHLPELRKWMASFTEKVKQALRSL